MTVPLPWPRIEIIADRAFWIVTCPSCGRDGRLTDREFHGQDSVNHASQFEDCRWHETIDFAGRLRDLAAEIAARRDDADFMGRLAERLHSDAELMERLG